MTPPGLTPNAWKAGSLSYGARLTLKTAKAMLEAGEREAEKLGVPMVIAIVDAGGNLLAFNRMDDAMLLSINIAIDKAFTGVYGKTPSGYWKKQLQTGAMVPGRVHERLVVLGGGYLIVADGVIIGGIGVSGGTIEDHYVARAALRAGGFATQEVDAYISEVEGAGKKK